MAEGRKKIKTGVKAQSDPRYQWDVAILDLAHREAREFLTSAQYRHLAAQVKEMAKLAEPTTSDTVDIRDVAELWEIRDKGGILGNINARIFFGMDHKKRTIVILGALNKKNDGPTPQPTLVKVRRRWREYQGGAFNE